MRNDIYESPVNLVVQDITIQMHQKDEQMILEAIGKCDVTVDKEELIKAIKYDRNQYKTVWTERWDYDDD